MSSETAETPKESVHSQALTQVAQHEKRLMTQIEDARVEAEDIIAKARVEAKRIADTTASEVEQEIAAAHEKAAGERERERNTVVEAAESKARGECGRASLRVDAAAERISALVLPEVGQ